MASLPEATLRAGIAEIDITPGLGVGLAGQFHARVADSVESPLLVKAMALSCGGVTVLLITCDVIMVPCALVDPALDDIVVRTQVPRDHVVVSATHTHSGPATMPHTGEAKVDRTWLDSVRRAIVAAAVDAVSHLAPARIAVGQGAVDGVCFNRRDRLGAGPTDPTVTSLLVETPAGVPIAFWANLSLHYVSAGSETAISSDYFGAVAERLGRLVGTSVHGQLTNGCSGDINNVDPQRAVDVNGAERAELVATAVAGAVAAATMMAPRRDTVTISAVRREVIVDRVAITAQDRVVAAQLMAGERTDAPFSYVSGPPLAESLRRRYAERLAVVDAMPVSAATPVSVIAIGDLCLVGLPGEMFVEFGLDLRRRLPFPFVAPIGLAGDHIGYCPTEKAFDKGGYETWRSPVNWTAPGTGERLVDAAVSLMDGSH